jgi:hypothetical protein
MVAVDVISGSVRQISCTVLFYCGQITVVLFRVLRLEDGGLGSPAGTWRSVSQAAHAPRISCIVNLYVNLSDQVNFFTLGRRKSFETGKIYITTGGSQR